MSYEARAKKIQKSIKEYLYLSRKKRKEVNICRTVYI